MKKLFILGLVLGSLNAFASDKGNGGDICENQMRNIANDIESWLLNDEYSGIKLPVNIGIKTYKQGMLSAVRKSVLSCTTGKIFVGGAEKSCKNFRDNRGIPRIICNFERFTKTEEKEKYKLMHHEFAGVAQFEANNGKEASVYVISNQISDFLRVEEVLKLGIKPDAKIERDETVSENAKIIKNVTICSISCNNVGYNIHHNAISYGTITYNTFNEDNTGNRNVCISDGGKELDIASDRASGENSFGIDLEECSKILLYKYMGKKVDLITEELSENRPNAFITNIKLK
jgi:hypothetical protein